MGRYRWLDWRWALALVVCTLVLLVAFLMQM
jgi:hypothetical protein